MRPANRDRKSVASELAVGDPLAESTTHGPIANRPQFERVQTMIGVGLEEGAKLVIGGPDRPDKLQIGLHARRRSSRTSVAT